MKKNTTTQIMYIFLGVCIILLLGFIYLAVPKITNGDINEITELKERYSLYNIPNFNTKGVLTFIEQRYVASHQIVVLGIFADDIQTFKDSHEIKDLVIDRSTSTFYLPAFVEKKISNKLYNYYHIKRTEKQDEYTWIDDGCDEIGNVCKISFMVKGSRHQICINLKSKRFVLGIYTK